MGADLPQQAIDQLPGITWFDQHTGVSKDRVLLADQVPAREARLIAGDLDVSERFGRHDQITSSPSRRAISVYRRETANKCPRPAPDLR